MKNHFSYKASLVAVSTLPLAILLGCVAYYWGLGFISTFNGVIVASICLILFFYEGNRFTARFFMRAIPTVIVVSVALSISLHLLIGYFYHLTNH